MKVLWQRLSTGNDGSKAPIYSGTHSTSVDDVALPTALYNKLVVTLEDNEKLLPTSGRIFHDWRVALLERFQAPASIENEPKVGSKTNGREAAALLE
jgi:hypothetical protein